MMENLANPVTHWELESSGDAPPSIVEVAEVVMAKLDRVKSELIFDEEFLREIFLYAMSNESSFPREVGVEGMPSKIKKMTLSGRTKKIKTVLWLSQTEMDQLVAYKTERGDRTVSDLINELLCKALAAMRAL